MTTNPTETVEGLRSLADFFEQNPDLPLPRSIQVLVLDFPKGESKAEAARIARRLGSFEKESDDTLFRLTKKFSSAVSLRYLFYRENVCVKRIIGTKMVEESVPQGEQIYVTREVEEEIVEWDCPPLLPEDSSS